MPIDSLESLVDKIMYCRKNSKPVSKDLTFQCANLIAGAGTDAERAHLERFRAATLLEAGYLSPALNILENALSSCPSAIPMQVAWKDLTGAIVSEVKNLRHEAPENAEIGHCYDKLLELGCGSMLLHLDRGRAFPYSR